MNGDRRPLVVEIEVSALRAGDVVVDLGKIRAAHVEVDGTGIVGPTGEWQFVRGTVLVLRPVD